MTLRDRYSKGEGFRPLWAAISVTWPTCHVSPFLGFEIFHVKIHMCTRVTIDLFIRACHCFSITVFNDTFCTIKTIFLIYSLFSLLVKKINSHISLFFSQSKINNISCFSILTTNCIILLKSLPIIFLLLKSLSDFSCFISRLHHFTML